MKNTRIGRKLWEAAIDDGTDKQGLIGWFGNRDNNFRTTVEQNLNISFN